jgi:hypothetical protein
MKLVHRSHIGAVKSALDYMWNEGQLITYWRYKYLLGEMGSLKDMANISIDNRVIFFSLPEWNAWSSFGEPFYIDLPTDTTVSVGVAEMFHSLCLLKDVEDVICNNIPWQFLQIDKLEIVVPVNTVKQYYDGDIVLQY